MKSTTYIAEGTTQKTENYLSEGLKYWDTGTRDIEILG